MPMPTNPEQDVNQDVPVTSSPETKESVNETSEEQASSVDTATPEPGEEQPETTPAPVPSPVSTEAVDETGVPWKNRAVEASRKLNEIQSVVKETIEATLQNQQKKQEYTKEHIPQLRQYAQDHPEHAVWVDQQIEEIRSRDVANLVKTELTSFQKGQQDAQTRHQAETWITSDPVFKTCFVDTPTGKVWNQTDPLAQHMMQILNSPDPMTGKLVKDRPDALYVAADMAYGRFARMNLVKGNTQVTKLRKDLARVQKVTNVVSPGKDAPAGTPRSPVKKALENYNKTYSKNDIQEATRQHLLGLGFIKEE